MQLKYIILLLSHFTLVKQKKWDGHLQIVLKSHDPIFPLWLSVLSSHLLHLHPTFSKVPEPLLCARNCPGLGWPCKQDPHDPCLCPQEGDNQQANKYKKKLQIGINAVKGTLKVKLEVTELQYFKKRWSGSATLWRFGRDLREASYAHMVCVCV